MPFNVSDVDQYNKGLSRKEKRKWSQIANSSLKACINRGGSDETCAPGAIKTANGVIKKDKEKEALKNKEAAMQDAVTKKNKKVIVPVVEVIPPETGSGEVTEKDPKLAEYYGEPLSDIPYVPSSVTSFEQLDVLQQTEELSCEIRELTGMFTQMVQNIVYWFEGDKVAQLSAVADEFIARLDQRINGSEEQLPAEETAVQPLETGELIEQFAETSAGLALSLFEEATQPDKVLRMNVAIIKPGWGNERDNHYYSADMLSSCAKNFIGAKMYETDHVQAEKSTRTWVSTITDISGFEDGAPVGLVAIHDPGFAERMRNLNTAGLLDRMECSIYASGKAQTGFEMGGRKGKNVIEITDVESVDWVTRAGAGGRVLSLAESNTGGITMTDETKVKDEEVQPTETSNVPVTVHETEAVTSGSEPVAETPVVVEVIPTTSTTEAEIIQESTQTVLPEADVRSLLEASHLPKAAIERLAKETYEEEAAVTYAIETEKSYLAEVLQAGKVVGMGAPDAKSANKLAESEKARAEAAERVNKKFLGGYK